MGQPNLLCEFQVTERPVSKDKVGSTLRMTPEVVLRPPHTCTCMCTHVCMHICVSTNHGVNTKEGLPCVRLSVTSEDGFHHPCSQPRKHCGEVMLFVHGTSLELQSRDLTLTTRARDCVGSSQAWGTLRVENDQRRSRAVPILLLSLH